MLLLPIHVTAGLLAIAAGGVALYAVKGSWLHRRSGMIFVVAMLIMASIGAVLAGLKQNPGTVLGGVLTFYIVCTAVLTVRRPVEQSRGLLTSLMLLALTVSASDYALGFAARETVNGRLDGYPSYLYFAFGTIAALCALGDARTLRARTLEGARRLARHIWRMCFAMWFATASFFLGQAKVFPEFLRNAAGIRAIPVVLVLVVMFYWLGRVYLKRHQPGQLPLGGAEMSQ